MRMQLKLLFSESQISKKEIIIRCKRCGRKLRLRTSILTGYGETCLRKRFNYRLQKLF